MSNVTGPFLYLSEWEVRELLDRVAAARRLPIGEREEAVNRVAREAGISRRTLERYWTYRLETVTVDGYRALFRIRHKAPPTRVTAWERAA